MANTRKGIAEEGLATIGILVLILVLVAIFLFLLPWLYKLRI